MFYSLSGLYDILIQQDYLSTNGAKELRIHTYVEQLRFLVGHFGPSSLEKLAKAGRLGSTITKDVIIFSGDSFSKSNKMISQTRIVSFFCALNFRI